MNLARAGMQALDSLRDKDITLFMLAVISIASPQVAHTAYENDERVLELMTHGMGAKQPPTGLYVVEV